MRIRRKSYRRSPRQVQAAVKEAVYDALGDSYPRGGVARIADLILPAVREAITEHVVIHQMKPFKSIRAAARIGTPFAILWGSDSPTHYLACVKNKFVDARGLVIPTVLAKSYAQG